MTLAALIRWEWRALALGAASVTVSGGLKLMLPWLVEESVDALSAGGPGASADVGWLAAAMVLVAVVGNLVRIHSRVVIFDAARRVERDLRNRLFRHLQKLTPDDLRAVSVGDLLSRTTNDLANVRLVLGPAYLNIVSTIGTYAIAIPLLLSIDPVLTLWALLPNPLLLGAMAVFARAIMTRSREVQEQLGELSRVVEEDVSAVTVVRLFGREDWRHGLFVARAGAFRDGNLRLARLRGGMMPAVGTVAGLGMLLVLYVGGTHAAEGRITLGDFFAFSLYLGMMVWPTLALGWVLSMWQRGRASLVRLREVFDLRPSVEGGAAPLAEPVRGALVLRGLTVDRGGRRILAGLDLDVPAGSVVAVVGRTGSGKSTLINALARLVPIAAGDVRLDGVDVTTLSLGALRQRVALVPQETHLFSATVRENIAFGACDGRADAAAIDEAVRVAAFAADLPLLPDGLDTIVGERGLTLSGGQRQRVAIARALVREPAVLLLDDCLSSLDAETERSILERLPGARAGRTTVLVTHRLSAVQWADRIVVLAGGRIVEEGRHAELVTRGGVYAALFEEQERAERATRALEGA